MRVFAPPGVGVLGCGYEYHDKAGTPLPAASSGVIPHYDSVSYQACFFMSMRPVMWYLLVLGNTNISASTACSVVLSSASGFAASGFAAGVSVAGFSVVGVRVVDPVVCSFVSLDPLPGVVGSGWFGSGFVLVGCDPVGLVDPWGLRPLTVDELHKIRDLEVEAGKMRGAAVLATIASFAVPGPAGSIFLGAVAGGLWSAADEMDRQLNEDFTKRDYNINDGFTQDKIWQAGFIGAATGAATAGISAVGAKGIQAAGKSFAKEMVNVHKLGERLQMRYFNSEQLSKSITNFGNRWGARFKSIEIPLDNNITRSIDAAIRTKISEKSFFPAIYAKFLDDSYEIWAAKHPILKDISLSATSGAVNNIITSAYRGKTSREDLYKASVTGAVNSGISAIPLAPMQNLPVAGFRKNIKESDNTLKRFPTLPKKSVTYQESSKSKAENTYFEKMTYNTVGLIGSGIKSSAYVASDYYIAGTDYDQDKFLEKLRVGLIKDSLKYAGKGIAVSRERESTLKSI